MDSDRRSAQVERPEVADTGLRQCWSECEKKIVLESLQAPRQVEATARRYGAGIWQVEVDPGQMGVAILNLVVNAKDAMADERKLTIETSNSFH